MQLSQNSSTILRGFPPRALAALVTLILCWATDAHALALPCAPDQVAVQIGSDAAMGFVVNPGNSGSEVHFQGSSPAGSSLFFESGGGVTITLPGGGGKGTTTTAVRFIGANAGATPFASEALGGTVSYLVGPSSRSWHQGLSTYGAITYGQLYPGVDLTYRADGRQLHMSFTVAPGADPKQIRWTYDGSAGKPAKGKGQAAPTKPKGSSTLEASIALAGANRQRTRARTRQGGAVITGTIAATTLGRPSSGTDAYMAVVDERGIRTLTVLGGAGDDQGGSVTTLNDGSVVLAGTTSSADLPTVNALQGRPGGGRDAFIARLDPATGTLISSTYLGGAGDDTAEGVAVDAAGSVWVAGPGSRATPTTGATHLRLKTVFPVSANPTQIYNVSVLDAGLTRVLGKTSLQAPNLSAPISLWIDCEQYMVLGTTALTTAGCDIGAWDLSYELSIATGYDGSLNNWGELGMQWKLMKNITTHTYDPSLATYPSQTGVFFGDHAPLNTTEAAAFTSSDPNEPDNPRGTWQSNLAEEGPDSDDAAKLSVGIALYHFLWDSPVFATMGAGSNGEPEMFTGVYFAFDGSTLALEDICSGLINNPNGGFFNIDDIDETCPPLAGLFVADEGLTLCHTRSIYWDSPGVLFFQPGVLRSGVNFEFAFRNAISKAYVGDPPEDAPAAADMISEIADRIAPTLWTPTQVIVTTINGGIVVSSGTVPARVRMNAL